VAVGPDLGETNGPSWAIWFDLDRFRKAVNIAASSHNEGTENRKIIIL
jgi:hypothetical protein